MTSSVEDIFMGILIALLVGFVIGGNMNRVGRLLAAVNRWVDSHIEDLEEDIDTRKMTPKQKQTFWEKDKQKDKNAG